jgi:hypothetical protein
MPVPPKSQNDHPLFAAPLFPDSAIGKMLGCHRHREAIPCSDKGVQCRENVFRLKTDYQVDIAGEALISMSIDRQTADDEIFHAGTIKCADYSFDTCDFHPVQPRVATEQNADEQQISLCIMITAKPSGCAFAHARQTGDASDRL